MNSRRASRARVLATLSSLALLTGCAGGPATQVLVEVDGDDWARFFAETLRVRVYSQEGQLRFDEERTLSDRDRRGIGLPVVVPIVPIDGDASRTFRFEATLYSRRDLLGEQQIVAGFLEGQLAKTRVEFTKDCRVDDCHEGCEAVCPQTDTCVAGACVDARVEVVPVFE